MALDAAHTALIVAPIITITAMALVVSLIFLTVFAGIAVVTAEAVITAWDAAP